MKTNHAVASLAKITGTGERIAVYEIADNQMAVGSTLGGPKAVTILKSTGAIERIYSPDAGETMLGTIVLHHWDEQTGVWLRPETGEFHIHPARQGHHFNLGNGVQVREQVFVLSSKPVGGEVDPPVVYYSVELQNNSEHSVSLGSYVFSQLSGSLGSDVEVAYDARRHALVVTNSSRPQMVRILGCTPKPTSFEVTSDQGKASSVHIPGTLSQNVTARGADPLGVFHFSSRLKPGQTANVCLKASFSANGRDEALANFDAAPDVKKAIDGTIEHYDEVLARAVLITPDSEVNRGVLWAKANMLRVRLKSPTGWCFVNDPTRSNNSVARDTAWFAMGADYVMPNFARESLLWYADHLEASGMVPEYYDIRNGEPADYKLNINDDTPLLIIALWHHYNATGNRGFLERVYDAAVRAARYILTQRNQQGLVWCSADGTADWGIAGWRNVIQGYRLSGATTEINSECYAALKTVSQMAGVLGNREDEGEFRGHAEALRDAINIHLFDKKRSLYYLNIDLDGSVRTDVTGDLVFPVMFGVADDDVAAAIINRLSVEEFWTEGGMRTVPRGAPTYSPTHGYGLLGGVWVNETIWFAMGAARFNPEVMAGALSTSFKYYSQDPRRNNTVPGQFSEWLHGETLVNQGMMLSPWFAPQYVWAAIEGVAGLNIAGEEISVTPRPAPSWKWLGVRNLQLRGKSLTWFAVRQPELRMYANFSYQHSLPAMVFSEDCTDEVQISGEPAAPIALKRGSDYAIFVGNTDEHGITTALQLTVPASCQYAARTFNSLREAWVESRVTGAQLRQGLPVQLDRKGFCVIELSEL